MLQHASAGRWVGMVSVVLAAVAFIPSTAAFTPAVLLTLIAFAGATIAASMGSLRLAALTFFIVCATLLVTSRLADGLARVEYLLLVFAAAAVIFGVVLYSQYRDQN